MTTIRVGNTDQWPPDMPATGDGVGVGIVRLGAALTGHTPGEENILSAETDSDGWYTGMPPGFSKAIGVRKVIDAVEGDYWQARVGEKTRPHKYLNKTAAQQGALAEVQRMRIASQD